jgi:Domain of unknown function (DUF397)
VSLTQFELRQLTWRKARRSMNNGDCLEMTSANGRIFIRDSKNPCGPVLEYTVAVWCNFLAEAKQDSIG